MRQLYVVVPKLYRHSTVADKGSLCEVIIYNRGKQVEEDIQIQIDPDLKCELLATSSTGIILSGSLIELDRLHKASEVSAIILVENGILDISKLLSISSKSCKGRGVDKIKDVPLNGANTLMGFIGLAIFGCVVAFGPKAYEFIDGSWANYRLAAFSEKGWSGLGGYYHSSMSNSYALSEFPIKYVGREISGGKVNVIYEVYNKTALPLTVYTDQKGREVDEKNTDRKPRPFFASVDVPPLEKRKFTALASAKKEDINPIRIDFSFKNGEEFFYKIQHQVPFEID